MTDRLTIICPAAHRADANQLAMVLGYGPADALTYGEPTWQDSKGNLYAAASLDVSPMFTHAATSPLQRPEWDTDEIIDMAAAQSAQAKVIIWGLGEDEPAPKATPDNLLAMFHPDPLTAMAMAGVTQIEGVE